jgi:methionyl aminopeptidase
MITLKSAREIELMREAGRIVAEVHRMIEPYIQPGISTLALDQKIETYIRQRGGSPSFKGYNGFPAASCMSINHVLVHGIPDATVLKSGDILSIDVGVNVKGYHGDSAWTYPVGDITAEAQRLLEVTHHSLWEGLAQVKAGAHLSDVSHAIGAYVLANGMSVPYEYTGHGIGASLHENPAIPNLGPPAQGPRLKAGMTLAIEPMVHLGRPETQTLADQWTVVTRDRSLAAHYEHTVLVTKEGYELLTSLPKEEQP